MIPKFNVYRWFAFNYCVCKGFFWLALETGAVMITPRLQIKPFESLRSEGCVLEKDSDFQNDPLYLKGTRMRESGVDILGCDRLAFNPLETVLSSSGVG